MLVYQRVAQQFSNITLGTYINFGYPQLQGLPRGPPFQGSFAWNFHPVWKAPQQKSMGPTFWREIFSRKWVMLMISLMFSGSQTVFLKGIFEAINFCTCHAQVGGSSSRHENYDDLRMFFIRIWTHVHLFFLATVIDFWSPLSPRRVCHFLFLARKLHGRVADFVGSNFFLTRHRCCLSLLNVFFFCLLGGCDNTMSCGDVQVHCMGGVGWVGWAVWRGGMR